MLGGCKEQTLIQAGTSLLFIYNGHTVLVTARPTKRSLTRAEAAAKLKIHRGVSTYRTAAKAAVFNNFAQPATNLLSKSGPKTWLPIRCDLTLPHTHQNAFVRTCAGLPLRGCHSRNTLGCVFPYLYQSFKQRKTIQRYLHSI